MQKHFLIRHLPYLATVAGIIFLASKPGGRLIPYAVGIFLVALLFAYFGFIKKDNNAFRFRLQAGAVIMYMLALLLAYISHHEQNSKQIISEWITPYPNINEVTFLPRTSSEIIWHWILESQDQPEKIINFYSTASNTKGWTVSKPGKIIIFNKPGYKLTLSISKRGQGSRVYFSLVKNN